MDIERTKRHTLGFDDVKPGQVFKAGDNYMMRFDSALTDANSINLITGKLHLFESIDKVQLVECKLVVDK